MWCRTPIPSSLKATCLTFLTRSLKDGVKKLSQQNIIFTFNKWLAFWTNLRLLGHLLYWHQPESSKGITHSESWRYRCHTFKRSILEFKCLFLTSISLKVKYLRPSLSNFTPTGDMRKLKEWALGFDTVESWANTRQPNNCSSGYKRHFLNMENYYPFWRLHPRI